VSDADRTHTATPKRVREFRKRGEIALSRDLVSAAALAGGAIGLFAGMTSASTTLTDFTRMTADAADGHSVAGLPGLAMHAFVVCAAPVTIGATAAALVAILGQVGWPPAFKSLGFDFARMSPVTNLPELFGLKGIARRGGAAVGKLVAVGVVVGAIALKSELSSHPTELAGMGRALWGDASRLLWGVLLLLALLAVADYALARRRMSAKMKMSTEELKREHREQDGDPLIRSKRRQKMRELAKRRIATAVKSADVVVVNPTHYAVALRYRDGVDRAPVVVAKGVDEVAARIRDIARQAGVPILSRPPLARALHKQVKEGRPVPAALYRAVAEVLAYVYRLRRGGAA
jgi:flagellar biosynthetic protein FlhB